MTTPSTAFLALKAMTAPSAGQSLQLGTSLTGQQVLDAVCQAVCPPVFSEQIADAAASTTRVARVYYAARQCKIISLGIVVDSTATANGTNYKTLDVKKFANGGAISSALATQMTTASVDLTARTVRLWTLTDGAIELAQGDILCIDYGVAAGGVQLSKHVIIGIGQVT